MVVGRGVRSHSSGGLRAPTAATACSRPLPAVAVGLAFIHFSTPCGTYPHVSVTRGGHTPLSSTKTGHTPLPLSSRAPPSARCGHQRPRSSRTSIVTVTAILHQPPVLSSPPPRYSTRASALDLSALSSPSLRCLRPLPQSLQIPLTSLSQRAELSSTQLVLPSSHPLPPCLHCPHLRFPAVPL